MIDEVTMLAAVLMISLVIYALTAGADFGGGVWDLLSWGPRRKQQRDLIARALAPIWEANHVWLVLVVVLLFVAFPSAFAALMISLHIPITIMLIGIVLRGTAFTFRHYDPLGDADPRMQRWSVQFAAASVVTPIMLGVCVGAVANGRILSRNFTDSWMHPFPFALGLFTLALFAFLAATYLTLETDDPELQNDFRKRALATTVVMAGLGWLCRSLAPHLFIPVSIEVLVGLIGLLALGSLWQRRYWLARALAALQVTTILWGWGLAQYPYILPAREGPGLTFHMAAAPTSVLQAMLAALVVGGALLLPSFVYLYRVFKRQ